MSENENKNPNQETELNPNTTQEPNNNDQQKTPVLDDDQSSDDQQITGEQFEPGDENVPEEIKEESEKLRKGRPDAFYKISEEEYDKVKESIPENLQRAVVDSKIETGAPPQLWIPVINNVALGLIAFVPGLNIAYAAVLYANLKILPMWPKKKVKNYSSHDIIENESKKTENPSSVPPSSFGTKDENNKKESFGSKNKNNGESQSFGTRNNNNNTKQNFGTGENGDGRQAFGAKKTTSLPNTSFRIKSTSNISVNFGMANTNSTLSPLTKLKQSFGSGKASSSPTPHVDNLNAKKDKPEGVSFGIRGRP